MRIARIGTVAMVAALASGCAWVRLAPEAHVIRVLTHVDAACERRGEVETKVTHSVATLERQPLKVRDELETLARNQAPSLHGNAVQALEPVRNGRQRFAVWRCPG